MQQAVQCDLLSAGGRDMMTQQEYMRYTGMQADSIASDGHFNGYAKSSFRVAVQSTYSKCHECLSHGSPVSLKFTDLPRMLLCGMSGMCMSALSSSAAVSASAAAGGSMLLFANNVGLQTMHQTPGAKMVVANSVSRLTNQVGFWRTVSFVFVCVRDMLFHRHLLCASSVGRASLQST